MLKNTLLIALIILAIYLYYQNRKQKSLFYSPSDPEQAQEISETIANLRVENEDLIAEKDATIRSKNEAQQEVLSLSNQLRNKQQEINRKESEIERIKKEKSNSEISLNGKLSERKKELEELKKKYSKQGQLLDEEQLENNKLTEKVEELETKITGLENRSLSPIPGSFPEDDQQELIKSHQEQLRKINSLFDENAVNYSQIDFNGLYSLLETIAQEQKKKKKNNRASSPEIPEEKVNK